MAGEGDLSKASGVDEGEYDSVAFESLESDFQEVLNELLGDKSLDRFRVEYEKLHRALKKSHSQEKRLLGKCRELNAEIVNNAAKVETALKLSQEDQNTIAALKKEVEKAWKMVDASAEKEVKAKEAAEKLKHEMAALTQEVEQGAGIKDSQETVLAEVMRQKDDLQKVVEEKAEAIKDLNIRADDLTQTLADVEATLARREEQVKEQQETLDRRQMEEERERRRKERLDKEMNELKERLEERHIQHSQLEDHLNKTLEENHALTGKLKDSRSSMEKYLRDYDTLYQKTQRLTEELDAQIIQSQQLAMENNSFQEQLKKQHLEVTKTHNDHNIIQRKLDREKKNSLDLVQQIDSGKKANATLQGQIVQLNNEILTHKRHEEQLNVKIDSLKRASELGQKQIQREQKKCKAVADQVKANERSQKNLENEISAFKQEASKQRKLIFQLEKDREKYGVEASEAKAKYMQALEEIKLREMQKAELQKKVTEGEVKLKQQQQLYEGVRSDRNLYSKNLIETQDEISEMKRKFKIMNHQIEQLKEEITAKDLALVKEHFDHKRAEKEGEQLKNELSKIKKLLEASEKTIASQNAEIQKLTGLIKKMDESTLSQRKEYDQVINERDILGSQLIRRNDELALLYEKLKIMHSTLRKGEEQYRERVQDIRILKLKIKDYRREVQVYKHGRNNTNELQREVYHLQKELLQAQTQVKALSEEVRLTRL